MKRDLLLEGGGNFLKDYFKEYFEKYIETYPNGHNPYDSMGEFYFNEGDMEKAKSFYLKAIEMYPSVSNAKEMVRKINAMENMQ